MKRFIDTLIVVAFAPLWAPLAALVALAVRIADGSPVVFRQERAGLGGRPFSMMKFRTMKSGEGSDAERTTRLGRLLRSTSLDELPQLFNVFSGDMSVVGPRPIVEDEVRYYGDKYALFSRVKPGITGLWQASGRSDTNYDRRVALDCHYVLNWSPWMDIWVIIRTAFVVLAMKGAR